MEPRNGNTKATPKRAADVCVTATICAYVLYFVCVSFYYWWDNGQTETACHANSSNPIIGTLLSDGRLLSNDGEIYPEGYFEYESDGFRSCACKIKPCIRKCCPSGEALSMETFNCTKRNYSSPFLPLQKEVYSDINSPPIKISKGYFQIIYGQVCDDNVWLLDPEVSEDDVNYLMHDGKLKNKDDLYTVDEYCLESFIEDPRIYPLACVKIPEPSRISEFGYPIGELISLVFFLVAFLVYVLLEELRNVHGLSLMCYVASLFMAYLILAVKQFELLPSFCVIPAFIIQFSFLASFFWLNIMCFDIWWVFSGLRPLRGSPSEREHKKFIIYSIYAWGCPVIIFIITLIMQTVQSIPDTYTKPEFGVDKCWFKSNMATFLYFYLPIIILVVLNIIMFITTAFRLRAHTKETEVLKSGESNRHDENERQRFNLYLKLFIVMGVNWVMELISWLAGGPKSLWYVTDVTNTLQGVLIFLIFVWKPRILRLLNQKLCPSLQLVPASTSSTRSKVSPSRTTSSSLKQTSSNNTHPEPDRIGLKKMTSDESDAPA